MLFLELLQEPSGTGHDTDPLFVPVLSQLAEPSILLRTSGQKAEGTLHPQPDFPLHTTARRARLAI